MIEGTVNARREAAVDLHIQGPDGRTLEIEAVVDTGYTRSLTLPMAEVAELGLPYANVGQAKLANDSVVEFPVHRATVIWDGQPRAIDADITGTTPLIGMLLMDGYNLNVDVKVGGRVVIQEVT